MSTDQIPWDDVTDAASEIFRVWLSNGDLQWARECWAHFTAAGLVGRGNIIEETASRLRLLTLARVYEVFCSRMWDEHLDWSITTLADDLDFHPIALGVLAQSLQPDLRNEDAGSDDLEELALLAVTESQRPQIFQCLAKAYGDEIKLYTRMAETSSNPGEHGSDEEFDMTWSNANAFSYVNNGFEEG